MLAPLHPDDDLPSRPAPQPRDLIAGLEKGLAVICAFDQERPLLSVTEVAEHCGLTRAAARRYLITLEHLGFMRSERGRWSLSAKVLRLAQSYMHSGRLPRLVQPELHRLVAALKEASSAGVLEGDDVICIAALSAGAPRLEHAAAGHARAGLLHRQRPRAAGRAARADRLEAWLAGRTLRGADAAHDHRRRARCVPNSRACARRATRWSTRNSNPACAPSPCRCRAPTARCSRPSTSARTPARRSIEPCSTNCLPALRQTQADLRRQL